MTWPLKCSMIDKLQTALEHWVKPQQIFIIRCFHFLSLSMPTLLLFLLPIHLILLHGNNVRLDHRGLQKHRHLTEENYLASNVRQTIWSTLFPIQWNYGCIALEDREYKSINGLKRGHENVQWARSLATSTMIVQDEFVA